jgi:hypothetical protein
MKLWDIAKKTYLPILAIPILVIFVGAGLNQICVIANHDKFPVLVNARVAAKLRKADLDPRVEEEHFSIFDTEYTPFQQTNVSDPDGMLDNVHCVMSPSSHLKVLGDIFDLHKEIQSIGDLLVDAGAWLYAFAPLAWIVLVTRKLIAGV